MRAVFSTTDLNVLQGRGNTSRLKKSCTPHPRRLAGSSESEIRSNERSRLRRELHDCTSQLLVALQLNLATLQKEVGAEDHREVFSMLHETLHELHRELRGAVSNVSPALRPGELPDALRTMTARFADLTKLHIAVDLPDHYVPPLPEAETSLYRIAQEALANVQRHAQARNVNVRLQFKKPLLVLIVEDDGSGFCSDETAPLHEPGTGLQNVRERMAELGGRFSFERLSQGSRITVAVNIADG